MAKKKKHYDLHQLLQEIEASEGLPENLSTEAQLWDEIMKKQAFLMPEQLFPLIKEIHGKTYEKGTEIRPLATEFSIERGDTKKITSIRADITVIVAQKDIYHFECEIRNNGTMVLRMFEYDVHIALSYREDQNDKMILKFPYSAVLYLQDNSNTPDTLDCRIEFQDGSTCMYQVPVLKIQSYSLEEIQEKHLCVLIPFLPLRFRKEITKQKKRNKEKTKKAACKAGIIEQNEELKSGIQKDELTSFYHQLILILDQEVQDGYLSHTNRKTIISLLNKSMIRVFYHDKNLLKEVVEMTEPILELEFEKYEKVIAAQAKQLSEKDSMLSEKDEALSLQAAKIEELQKQISALQRKS